MEGTAMEGVEDQIDRLVWTDELIQRFWDAVGRTSLDELSFGKLAGPRLVDLLSEYLSPGTVVCDYGAGGGHLARLLIEHGFPTAIYEPSRQRAEKLSRELDSLEGFLGVASGEAHDKFNVVIMSEVVEHLPDGVLRRALERAAALLVPGGKLVITTPNNESLEQGSVYCPRCNSFFHRWQHLRSFTTQSLADLLERNGFKAESIGLVDFSSDAEMVDRDRSIPELIRFAAVLDAETARFEGELRQAAGIFGALSADAWRTARASIAAHQAATAEELRQIAEAMPSSATLLRPLLLRLCGGFYARATAVLEPDDRSRFAIARLRQAVRRLRWKLRPTIAPGPPSRVISTWLGASGPFIAGALRSVTAPEPDGQRAAAGHDFYRGRGSTILYIGEKF
jgi:2-polyprenyl-3-methyl-5-hydroxy-6-metoxy-1,4-benzoquinol methylase